MLTRSDSRGLIIGGAVGLLGAGLWTAEYMVGFSIGKPFGLLFWWDPHPDSGGDHLEYVFPILLGPVIGILVSLVLGALVESFVLVRRPDAGRGRRGVIAGAAYLLTLAGLAMVAHVIPLITGNGYPSERFPGAMELMEADMMTGLFFAGPLALLSWAVLGGLVHGLWRSRKQG